MMSIKQIFVLSIIFLSCGIPEKKADSSAIRKVVDQYNNAYINKDWESLADVFHPKQFEEIPRDFFIKGLNISAKREHFKVVGNKIIIDSISPAINDNNDKYCVVYLRNEMISGFPSSDNLEEFCKGYKEGFDPDIVSCEVKGNQIIMVMRAKYYAVFLANKKKWFLFYPKEQTKEIVEKIIPLKVREAPGF